MPSYKKMDPETKAEWVTALRSGKYRQAKEALAYLKNKRYSYCCLGVLCNLDTRVDRQVADSWGSVQFVMGDEVFDDGEPSVAFRRSVGLSDGAMQHLIHMNDNEGKSFEEIADWIEERL